MRLPPLGLPHLRLRLLIGSALLLATLVPLAWWLFGPRGFAVELTQRSWRMEIEVERLRLETGADWCDELPEGAFDIARRLRDDPTGRRTAPSEHCRYSLLAWRRQWVARSEGGPDAAVQWPRPPLRIAPPGEAGSERLGRREAFYELALRDAAGRVWTCRTEPGRWQQLRPGQRFRMQVDRWGTADCGGLR